MPTSDSIAAGRRSAARRPAGSPVRWDRITRVALLVGLCLVMLSYLKPLATYVRQWQTARHDRAQVERFEAQHRALRRRAHELSKPGALDEQARRLGMVKPGERPYVVEGSRSR